MDQLKAYFEVFKKHHFWVLSGLIAVVGFAGWFLATGSLDKEYLSNRQKVEREFGELRQVFAEDPHPNDQWKQELAKQTTNLSQIVFKTWQDLYSKQKEKVLKWPKIDDEFLATMQTLPPDKEIPQRMRDVYRYDVRQRFPALVLSVGALPAETQKARDRLTAAQASRKDYIVNWNAANQEEIVDTFSWSDLPSSQQVRFAQEDLWAYTALVNIVKKVNEGATGYHNARLKKIDHIAIGSKASTALIKDAASSSLVGSSGEAAPAAEPSAGSLSPADKLIANRYVDEKGKPLAAGAEKPKQFNRMPVFMRVTIDQRDMGRFLVECANSPLPIEVRQFRLESPEYLASKSEKRLPGGQGGAGKALDLTPGGDEGYYDVAVEVFGIIYIFNPPDPGMLNNPQVAATGAASN